jgi:hypothetical protein
MYKLHSHNKQKGKARLSGIDSGILKMGGKLSLAERRQLVKTGA